MSEDRLELRVEVKAKNAILCRLVDKYGSTKEAAKQIGVSSSTLSAWINYRSHPKVHSLNKNPNRYARIFPRLEELTGRCVYDIFPKLPPHAKALLSRRLKKEVVTTTQQITSTVEREYLSYVDDMEDQVDLVIAAESIEEALKTLSYRERMVLKLRFGLDGNPPMSLLEAGHVLKVTKERVRQIEMKAIRKLQQPSRSQKLVEHISEGKPDLNRIDRERERRSKMSLLELLQN